MSIFSAFTTGIQATGGAVAEVTAGGGDRYFGDWLRMNSAAGMRVSVERSKQLTTVYACIAKKATAIAQLPFKVYQDDGQGGSKIATNHPLYDVLYSRPNHLQTAYEFKQMMQSHVEARGNAFAEIIDGDRGAVDELMPMHPDRVQVEQLQGSGRMRYRYNDPLTNTTRVLMQEEVFHLRELPDAVGVGQSRIAYGVDMLGLGLLQQDYRARLMANDATPGALITGANFRSKEDEDSFVESLSQSRTKANRGRPFLLPMGVDMKTLAITPQDAQLLEAVRATDVQICTMFNVLPHVVGVDAGKAATFASTEQFNLMHVQQTVLPMAIMWEQAIQRSLITNPRYYAKASVASLMRGDAATRGKYYQLMVSSGLMCPDEVRALEDLGPISDGSGKRFWNPLNWGLLNRTPALTTGAVRPGGTGAPGADDDEDDLDGGSGENDSDQEQAATMVPLIEALVEHGRMRPEVRA